MLLLIFVGCGCLLPWACVVVSRCCCLLTVTVVAVVDIGVCLLLEDVVVCS